MASLKDLPDFEPFQGNKACAGCGASLVVRWTLKALGRRAYAVIPAGCMSAVGFVWPQLAFGTNAMIAPFAATAAVLSGVAAGIAVRGIDGVAVGFAGDGATADIGLQALSGAFSRGERILYICYDNEAYMNTGIQRSGATPWGARTTTSPEGLGTSRADRAAECERRGSARGPAPAKKDLMAIAIAHRVPYAATASVGAPADFVRKVQAAAAVAGPSFIHVMAPCPTGWGHPASKTGEIARQALACGLWYLSEWDGERVVLNAPPKSFSPVADYLGAQSRFARLGARDLGAVEAERDRFWERLRASAG
jgi:pyruvate ferredoxin oxidoreductase beta subunit